MALLSGVEARMLLAIIAASGAAFAAEEAPPAAKPLALSFRVGLDVPTNPLGVGPSFAVGADYALPVLDGALSAGASFGATLGGAAESSHALPAGGSYTTSLSRLAIPLLAEAAWRQPTALSGLFRPFAQLSLGMAIFSETLTVTYQPSQAVQETFEDGVGFAMRAALGTSLVWWAPGEWTVALSYAYGDPDFRAAGANMLGGLALEVGYRVPVF